ncbi:YfiT family bacillithiol transferase [Paenibacillus segetis]|uniref:Metal-dependent hydrolase n=1 Tax=Paenibacillus segetis TaxID=1325360 RepID=A0ABQ1YI28_9BACL|nr:putative metal-dependent hydrolase [Paenibacillus segetis]GGH27059.1 putative metal-dependent hydrolase [Paenibacillus segetis]
MDPIRFPIGRFEPVNNADTAHFMNQIPGIIITLRYILKDIPTQQLHIPYRPDGWTIQQIVHHLADNDMNAYIRFKRALTEDEPMASSYREDLWAELNDYKDIPIENSLLLLELLHKRLHVLLNGLSPEDFQRKLKTQVLGTITLDIALQRFIWHNKHHISKIETYIISRGRLESTN